MQINMDASEILAKTDIARIHNRIDRVVKENDWVWFPIVDVVVTKEKKRHSRSMYYFHVDAIKIRRYGDQAPNVDESREDGRHCEIYRLTRPQLEEYFRRGLLPEPNNPTLEP